jgi:hypothetical protein
LLRHWFVSIKTDRHSERNGEDDLLGQPLDLILVLDDIHQRHAWDLSYSPTQISVALLYQHLGMGRMGANDTHGGDDIAFVDLDSLDQAVVCICPAVCACQYKN